MNDIYPMWVAAHGVMIVTPVNWYQVSSPLKLMMDRLVCADGGNPDPTLTQGKDAQKAKELELAGWDYPRHLEGRLFSVVVHGDVEGADPQHPQRDQGELRAALLARHRGLPGGDARACRVAGRRARRRRVRARTAVERVHAVRGTVGEPGASPSDSNFRELFVRWFQFGAFSPIFRVHGTRFNPDENELWSYGPEAGKILAQYDTLRYRLLPYIYSLASKTTSEGYTPMRPLVMDFRQDVNAQNIGDQFMYGPAVLVNPVTEPGAATRHLYLPSAKWYDFWTGSLAEGGKFVDASAPLDRMPLYVRAGSIIPMGPAEEYSNQKPADPIELRVYSGADGDFTLYEDEGDTYNYEKGKYATIPIHWNDATRTLTIAERKGSFPGMLESRKFHLTFVRESNGVGVEPAPSPDQVIEYSGKRITATAK